MYNGWCYCCQAGVNVTVNRGGVDPLSSGCSALKMYFYCNFAKFSLENGLCYCQAKQHQISLCLQHNRSRSYKPKDRGENLILDIDLELAVAGVELVKELS